MLTKGGLFELAVKAAICPTDLINKKVILDSYRTILEAADELGVPMEQVLLDEALRNE